MKIFNPLLEQSHVPVMLDEVINICSSFKNGVFLDCTFGGGGYSKALLKLNKSTVISLDRDNVVSKIADQIKKKHPKRFYFHQEKFSNLDKSLKNKKIDAAIFDLGISSLQLDDFSRGFSFKSKDKLNMSMGLTSLTAEEVINSLDEKKLKLIIKTFGEETDASLIARNIIKVREKKKITKVNELVEIIEKSKKKGFYKKNICTKTFQALRIFVNKEISEIIDGIIKATEHLKPGGKLIIVSFHSLEDKIIKFYFSNYSSNKSNPSRYLPYETNTKSSLFEKYKNKIYTPSLNEKNKNDRSRSAKLRVATRNQNKFFFPNDLKIKFKNFLEIEESYG